MNPGVPVNIDFRRDKCDEFLPVYIAIRGRRVPNHLKRTPEGDALLYLKEETVEGTARRGLWRGSLAEETETPITDEAVDVFDFALSPDGKFVVYSTRATAEGQEAGNEVHVTASDGSTESLRLYSRPPRKSAGGGAATSGPKKASGFRMGYLPTGGRISVSSSKAPVYEMLTSEAVPSIRSMEK